jgi:hypothetical protein
MCHLENKNVTIHCFDNERRERDKGMKEIKETKKGEEA